MSMMINRRQFSQFLGALALTSALPGKVLAADEKVEFTIAHTYGKIFRPIHTKIIKEFNKIYPNVRIRLEAPMSDYEELTQRTLSGIAQGNAPVLSFQGVNQFRQYIELGAAYDITPFTKDDPRWGANSDYYPEMMKLCNFDGKQYGVPFAISTPIMYANHTLLAKAGVDLSKPFTTWQDVIEAAKKVRAYDPKCQGIYVDYQATGNWIWQAFLYSEGGTMMDDAESRVTFADEPGVRAAKLLREFIDLGLMEDSTALQGQQSFISGRAGFYVASTSWLKGVQDKIKSFDVRTHLFPQGSTGIRRLPCGGNGALIITKDPKVARAAYEYAMFASGPIGTAIQVAGSGYMPMNKNGTEALQPFYEKNPNFRTSLAQIPTIFRWYAFPGTNTLKIIDVIKNDLQAIVGKRVGAEEGIKAAAAEVAKLLPKK